MYAKIFSQIFDSTLADDYQTRHVFMDLLVLADKHGEVDMTAEAIARRINVPGDIVKEAICKLCKHDVNSRSKTADGARLVLLDSERPWGWKIVNYVIYSGIRDENTRREYMRGYMRARRKAQEPCKQPVNSVNFGKPLLASVPVLINTSSSIKGDTEPGTLGWSRDTKWYGINAEDKSAWLKAYPACNIDRQLAAMSAWLEANPAKAVKRQWRRFIVNWLARSQERGGDEQARAGAAYRGGAGKDGGRIAAASAPGGFDAGKKVDLDAD